MIFERTEDCPSHQIRDEFLEASEKYIFKIPIYSQFL